MKKINRRKFLKIIGQAGAAIVLAGCQNENMRSTLREISPSTTLASIPSQTPRPSSTAERTSTPGQTSTPSHPIELSVATGRVAAYDPVTLRVELEKMINGIGGLTDLIRPGARVGVKVNMTGGTWWDGPDKPLAVEFFVTHPLVVKVIGEILKDAGASKLYIMDGLGDETSFDRWGYSDIAAPLDAQLINLCKSDPFTSYKRFLVPGEPQVYDHFMLNPILGELDVFLSIAKLKCHSTTGVTLAMKNLIGLTPIELYRRQTTDNNRSALHGSVEFKFDARLPRIILDLNQACPIDLAVIDGIMTAEGGAGPWDQSLAQVKPGLLVAGRNPVSTDAVATAIMGFDPAAPTGSSPFLHGDNHLALAAKLGLGSNRIDQIYIAGPSISEIGFPFKPAM